MTRESLRYLTTLNIGKKGLTEQVTEEIKLLLRKKKILRVKFLKSAIEQEKKTRTKKELFESLASLTNSRIEKAVGFIVVLRKK